ncbi:MAG: putative sugar O-methyltransferase [Pseudomonadota bacterium]
MTFIGPGTIKMIDRAKRLNASEPRTVTFVTPLLRAREIKIAVALRDAGWKVILLYVQTTPFEPSDYFDIAIKLSMPEQLHQTAHRINPRVCHVFSGAIDENVLAFCREKPGPVIVDLNDVFCPSLFNYLQERFEPTRECLSLADGLICRDLQPKFAERYDWFVLPPNILLFPEYSWMDGPNEPDAVQKLDPDEVHVVSVGTFTLETDNMYDSAHLQLTSMMIEQGIHFHIYPHWFYQKSKGSSFQFNQREAFRQFYELADKSDYLHMHESLPVDELARVLPQYDFGLVAGGSEKFGQKLEFLTEKYMHACYSGRIVDYLDARLPVLINPEVKLNFWLLKRYGIVVDLDGLTRSRFRQELHALKQDPLLRDNLDKAAEHMNLHRHTGRLTRFYEKVARENPTLGKTSLWFKAAARVPRFGPRLRSLHGEAVNAHRFAHRDARYRALLTSLSGQVSALSADKALGAQELLSLGSRLEEAQRNEEGLTQRVASLQSDIEEKDAQISSLLKQRDDVERLKDKLIAENKIQKSEITVLQRHIKTVLDNKSNISKNNPDSKEENDDYRELERLYNGIENIVSISRININENIDINDISGLLNWSEVSNEMERNNGFLSLLNMFILRSHQELDSTSTSQDNVSQAWKLLNYKNLDQLLHDGYNNFKRTIAMNYFTFPIQKDDPQIADIEGLLEPESCTILREWARTLPEDDHFNLKPQEYFRYHTLLLATYAHNIDETELLQQIEEPLEGNPVVVPYAGKRMTQDLANSVIEYYSVREGGSVDTAERILEIGGGYGRNAFVFKHAHPGIEYVMVDIPPALFIAQRYLSSIFGDQKIFTVRDFDNFDDVKDAFEGASIAFLLPHQLELLPEKYFDITINISCFGEMRMDQIEFYFDQIDRVTKGQFFTKQWRESRNPFDDLVLYEDDYPVKDTWKKLYSRACATNTAFFSDLYDVGVNS